MKAFRVRSRQASGVEAGDAQIEGTVVRCVGGNKAGKLIDPWVAGGRNLSTSRKVCEFTVGFHTGSSATSFALSLENVHQACFTCPHSFKFVPCLSAFMAKEWNEYGSTEGLP